MLRRVNLYVCPNEQECGEISEFLKKQEIDLVIRDIKARPLGVEEITQLFRHFDTKHFLNEHSNSFTKHKLDVELPPRPELYELMAQDNDLIKRPVVVAGRLMVIGCNISKIKEMLQLRDAEEEPDNNSLGNRAFNNGRSGKGARS